MTVISPDGIVQVRCPSGEYIVISAEITSAAPAGQARVVADVRLRITLGIGLVLGVAAIAVTLSRSPLTITRVNTAEEISLETSQRKIEACQSGELLPRETSAIRLRVDAFLGPRVALDALAHGHVIVHGERGSGWTGGAVTVPVSPLSGARSGVDLCFVLFQGGDESSELIGEPTARALAARGPGGSLPGRLRVEYMRPGTSWWSLAPAVARRMGFGRAVGGTWSVLLALVLMGSVVVVCSRAVLRWLR